MTSYKARFWREGDVWELELVDEPGVHTFASTLGRARRYLREATAAWYDLDPSEVDILDEVKLPGGLADRVRVVLDRRVELDRAAADMAGQTTRLVNDLLDAGLSVRDAGDLVQLSPQRVSQLASSHHGPNCRPDDPAESEPHPQTRPRPKPKPTPKSEPVPARR